MDAQTLVTAAASMEQVVWERTACTLCGRDDAEPIRTADDASGLRVALARCRGCGLCYTNPRPSTATIGAYYPEDYAPYVKEMGRSGKQSLWRRTLNRWSDDPRKGMAPRGAGQLLEFGCGSGSYLLRMREQGWTPTGLDFSPTAVERVRSFGIEAFVGSLPCDALAGRRYDAIAMWHALEHVHDPLAVLRAARELSAPGARLIVATPNFASWSAETFGSAWIGLDVPRHLTHFTPATLAAFLERAGFRVVRMRTLPHPGWIRKSAAEARRQGASRGGWCAGSFGSRIAALWAKFRGRSDGLEAIAEPA